MWEIAGLAALAILFFGPEKLPELARRAARIMAHLRRIGDDARGQLRKELGPEFDDFHLSDLNPRTLVARHLLSGEEVEDLRQIRDEALQSGQLVREAVDDVRGTGSHAATTDAEGSADAGGHVQTLAPDVPQPRWVPYDPEAT